MIRALVAPKRRKTWQEKVGKRLMKHVYATTDTCTKAEIMVNLRHQQASGDRCDACLQIARRAGWKLPA